MTNTVLLSCHLLSVISRHDGFTLDGSAMMQPCGRSSEQSGRLLKASGWQVCIARGQEVDFTDRPDSLPFRIYQISSICHSDPCTGPFVRLQEGFLKSTSHRRLAKLSWKLALLLNVAKDSLVMFSHGIILDYGSFILGIDDLEDLEVRWRPVVSIPQFPMITDQSIEPAGCKIIEGQSEDCLIRLAAVHPVWGSIRTAMVNGQSTIHDAIKVLLPDWPIQSNCCIAVDGKIVDCTVLVEMG